MSPELEDIFTRVQAELARAVDEPTYRIWLAPLRALELEGERLIVEAPEPACEWIRTRFGGLLQASTAAVLGTGALVELSPGPSARDESCSRESPLGPSAELPWGSPAGGHGRAHSHSRTGLGWAGAEPMARSVRGDAPGNPKLTFEQFVIGGCNRLAHAAALTVAEMPASAYNPLFICGPPGVGKTHLLNAIAGLLLSHNPGLTVRCTTGEGFTNEFLHALAARDTDEFKARFRRVDVLLLDDVQFLERKTRTEEEFFHTFNALHDAGQQIVLTSDRPPHDLQALEDRLRDRFQAGLVADVKAPELATRLAILRKRAHDDRVELADDLALAVIAERVDSNVRALEGALVRVIAFSSLTGRPLTAELAREVLDGLYPLAAGASPRRPSSIDDIKSAVCAHFRLSSEELLSQARSARITWPRQVAMYLARELTGESLPAIGRHFGGRDHTTVLHSIRRTSAKMQTDQETRMAVDGLRSTLERPQPSP